MSQINFFQNNFCYIMVLLYVRIIRGAFHHISRHGPYIQNDFFTRCSIQDHGTFRCALSAVKVDVYKRLFMQANCQSDYLRQN